MARATSRGVGPLPAIDDPDCVPKLEALLRSEPPMTIAMFHLQAAPRSVSAIVADDDGFYGDFVPILEGKGKPTGGAPLAHDYDTYLRGVFPYVLPSFRFFYNNGDTRTAGTASGAGITRSTTWVRDVRPASTTSSGLFVGHYLCDRDGVADLNEADTECRVGESSATEHDPRFALSALSNPLRTLVWKSVE